MGEDPDIVLTVDEIEAFEKTKIISQIALVKERLRSFEAKYRSNLETFEARSKQLPDDFELWDDLIEWKACAKSLKDLESR